MKPNILTTDNPQLTISPCEQKDIDEIFLLYSWATQLQKSKGMVEWPSFPRSLVEMEIKEGRIWKLIFAGTIACVWSITFSDAQIWEEKDKDDAIYIHRIATHPEFRGNKLVHRIVEWSKSYANSLGKGMYDLIQSGEIKSSSIYTQQQASISWACFTCKIYKVFRSTTTKIKIVCCLKWQYHSMMS